MAALVGWWLGLAAAVAALVTIHDLGSGARATIIILVAAGLVQAAACRWLHVAWPGWSAPTRRQAILLILLGGLVLRATLLTTPPTLSDDVFRYRWDGRVQAAGHNPYAEAPASSAHQELRDPLWQEVNYPRIRTIYPPLAQWLFLATYLLGGGLLSFQLLAVAGDALATALLLACLATWRLPRWRVALWAWSPLVAVETASSGHYDAWTVAAVLAAVLLAARRRCLASSLAVAAGILLKSWPLVLVPLLVVRRGARHLALVAGTVAGAYGVYAGAGAGILQPWLDYTGRWLFNDSGFWLLRTVTGSQPLAKGIAALIVLVALRWLWVREVDPVRGSYWLLLLCLLFMPAVHPWYLLWPLPLAALALDRGWIALTVLAPLSYWILVVNAAADSNAWVEPVWVRFVLYLPPLALWVHQAATTGPPAPPPLAAADPGPASSGRHDPGLGRARGGSSRGGPGGSPRGGTGGSPRGGTGGSSRGGPGGS